jgi:hypothetical protein
MASSSKGNDILVLLVLAIFCGLTAYWGYGFFEDAKNAPQSTIKNGLGPLFGILTMACGAGGVVFFMVGIFYTLNDW